MIEHRHDDNWRDALKTMHRDLDDSNDLLVFCAYVAAAGMVGLIILLT